METSVEGRIWFDKILEAIRLGTVFIEESDFGQWAIMRCTEAPELARKQNKITWKAVEVNTGKESDYLVTRGLEHYGPKLLRVVPGREKEVVSMGCGGGSKPKPKPKPKPR
jgi:hypothetical protein